MNQTESTALGCGLIVLFVFCLWLFVAFCLWLLTGDPGFGGGGGSFF